MYTVMIVEDELLVRMGLMASLPWDVLNLRVVAESANGLDAWEKWQKHRPDIVLTDIRIPGMNGLELMRAVRAEDSTCALIVITCVEEFSTLQETMGMGVVDYLVKATMKQQDIIQAVQKARAFLEKNQRPSSDDSRVGENEALMRRFFLGDGQGYDELMKRCGDELPPHIPGFLYMRMARAGGIAQILRRSVQNILCERLSNASPVALTGNGDGILVLLRKPLARGVLQGALMGVEHYCRETFGLDVLFAACLSDAPVKRMPEAVARVEESYRDRYLYDDAVLFVRADGAMDVEAVNDCLSLLQNNLWLLRDGDSMSEIRDLTSRLERDILCGWTALINAAYSLARYVKGRARGLPEESFQNFCRALKETRGLSGVFLLLREQIVLPALQGETVRPEIATAIGYMSRNLREDVSLTRLAAAAGLHPTYFSRLFKQEMGMGFSDFLTILRVDQAQALLRQPNLSIQEVADQCGFSDVSYFCRKFKFVVGASPSAWRMK